MKKILLAAATLTTAIPLTAQAEDLLTGDVRLACEAVLCLSSGTRPNECAPSLRRYFDITRKKLSDTISARHDFLQLCPASNEQGMPELVRAIANGAGRCDAAELNRVNQVRKSYQVCGCSGLWGCSGKDAIRTCRTEYKWVVKNQKPSYCRAYFDHAWTDVKASVEYRGNEDAGGRWVDVR
ncbi:TrbM/KikA/MpfK family conjugal transfer protein [Paralysiella testudinis]|uniref:Conjugal transfer protein TrbM n=1 Tax=Paralysiella testudinis TaxID=2809020 RepID=A0A892ZPZ5_9NEIS|nr:TrbM/KikA/MpfK family conjugal transfer protein [Paralysiella testudinis]QRQ82889.1 conjugal transfer protein TrbM [Paralysiella testudinis]